ncbi:MAG: hypothetical protein E7001_00900 [Coriobacteriaceae bacterium]|nr:hypothetical protein [Coriobacteriaceae bacterium]
MDTPKIIVACGTGGVTSKNIGKKIEAYLAKRGVACDVSTCRILEVKSMSKSLKPVLVASASELPALDVPTVRATAILTGVGAEKVFEQIYEIVAAE